MISLGPLKINSTNQYKVGNGYVYPPNPTPQIPFQFPAVYGDNARTGSFEFTSSNESVGIVVIRDGVIGGTLELGIPGSSGEEYGETTITAVYKDALSIPRASTSIQFKYYKYKPSIVVNTPFVNDTTVVGTQIVLSLVFGDQVYNNPQRLAVEYAFVHSNRTFPASSELICSSLTSTASATFTSTTPLDVSKKTFKNTYSINCLQVGYVQLKLTCSGSFDFAETTFAFYVKEVPTLTFTFPSYIKSSSSIVAVSYDITDGIMTNSTGAISFTRQGGGNEITVEKNAIDNTNIYTLYTILVPGSYIYTATVATTNLYTSKSVNATLKVMSETTLFYNSPPFYITPSSSIPADVVVNNIISSNRSSEVIYSVEGTYSGVTSFTSSTFVFYLRVNDLNYANKPTIKIRATVRETQYQLPITKVFDVVEFQRSFIDESVTSTVIDLVVGQTFYLNGFLNSLLGRFVGQGESLRVSAKFDTINAFTTVNPTVLFTNNSPDLLTINSVQSNNSIVPDSSTTGPYTIKFLTANDVGTASITVLFTRSPEFFESVPYKLEFEIRAFNNTLRIVRSLAILVAQTQTFPFSVDLNSYLATNSNGNIIWNNTVATTDFVINGHIITINSQNVLYKSYVVTVTQERTSTITTATLTTSIYFYSDSLEENPLTFTLPSSSTLSPVSLPFVVNLMNFTTTPSQGAITYALTSVTPGIAIVGNELRVTSLNTGLVTVYITVTQSAMIPYEQKIITAAYTLSKLIGKITYSQSYDANPQDITFFTQSSFNLSERFYFTGDGARHFTVDAVTSALLTLTTDPVTDITTVQTNSQIGRATIEVKIDDGIDFFGTNYFFTFDIVQFFEPNTLSFGDVSDIMVSEARNKLLYTRNFEVTKNSDANVNYFLVGTYVGITLNDNILTLNTSGLFTKGEIVVKATQARTYNIESAEITTSFQIILLQANPLTFYVNDVILGYDYGSYEQAIDVANYSQETEVTLTLGTTYYGISLLGNTLVIANDDENVYEGVVSIHAYQPASLIYDAVTVTKTFTVTKTKFTIEPFSLSSVLLNSYTFLPVNGIYFYTNGEYRYTTNSTDIIQITKVGDRYRVYALASGTVEITLTIDSIQGIYKTTTTFFFTVRQPNTVSYVPIPNLVLTPTSHTFPYEIIVSTANQNSSALVSTQFKNNYQGLTLLDNVITLSSLDNLYTGEVVLLGRQSSTPTVVAKLFSTSFTIIKQRAEINSFTVPSFLLNTTYDLPPLVSNSLGLIDVVPTSSSLVEVTKLDGIYKLYAKSGGRASVKITQESTNDLFEVSYTKTFHILIPNTLALATIPSLAVTPSTVFPYVITLSCNNVISTAPIVYSLNGTYSGMSIVDNKLTILNLASCFFGIVTVSASQIETTTVATTMVDTTFHVTKQTYVFSTVSMSTALVNTTVDLPSIPTLSGEGALTFSTADTVLIQSINNFTKKITTKSVSGTANITVTRADGSAYFGASSDFTLNIRLLNTLVFPPVSTVVLTPSTNFPVLVTLTTTGNNSELPTFTLERDSLGITIQGNEVSFSGVSGYFTGTFGVVASQTETSSIAAATIKQKINVIKQTSVFSSITMAANVVNATLSCPTITTLEGEGEVTFSTNDTHLITINNTTKKITTKSVLGTAYITVTRANGTTYFGGTPYTFPLTILNRNTLTMDAISTVVILPSTTFPYTIPFTKTTNNDTTVNYALTQSYSGISMVGDSIILSGVEGYYTGTVSFKATQAASLTVASKTVTTSFIVKKQTASITPFNKSDIAVLSTFNLPTVTTTGDGEISFTNNSPSTLAINPPTVTAESVGLGSITVNVADGVHYFGNSYTFTFNVGYIANTLAFGPITDVVITPTAPPLPFLLTMTTNNTEPIDYELVETYTGISILNGEITVSESNYYTGIVTVRAIQLASATVAAKTVTATFVVRKQTTTITKFTKSAVVVGTSFNLPAVTRTGTGFISFTNNSPTVITVTTNVTANSIGTGSITVVVADDNNYFGSEFTFTFSVISSSATLPNFTLNFNNITFSGTKTLPIPYTSPSSGAMTFSTAAPSSIVTVNSDAKTFTLASANVTFTITATQAASGNYLAQTVSKSITVSLGAAQPIQMKLNGNNAGLPISNNSTISLTSRQYNSSLQLGATSNNTDGAFTFSTTTPLIVDETALTTNTLTLLNIGSGNLKVAQAGGGFYNACNITINFQCVQGVPTILFPIDSIPYVPNGSFLLQEATSPSLGEYTYTTTSTNISLQKNTDGTTTVSLLGAGTSTSITATQASTTFFTANTVTTLFVVEKAVPVLTDFTNMVLPYNPISPLILSSDSTNKQTDVEYSSSDSFVTISENVLTMLGYGLCTVTATQVTTDNYLALEPVSITIDILKVPASIDSILLPEIVTYDDDSISFEEPFSTNTEIELTYTSSDESVATVDTTTKTITLLKAGTTTIEARQEPSENYLAGSSSTLLTVLQKQAYIAEFAIATKVYGDDPFQLDVAYYNDAGTLLFSSSDPSVASVNSSGFVTIHKKGETTITLSQLVNANYIAPVPQSALFIVEKRTPTVGVFAFVPNILYYLDAPFIVVPPTTNNSDVTSWSFTSSDENVATIGSDNLLTIHGVGSTEIKAVQAGDENNNEGLSNDTLLHIHQSTPAITLNIPDTITYAPNKIVPYTVNSTNAEIDVMLNLASNALLFSSNTFRVLRRGLTRIIFSQPATENFAAVEESLYVVNVDSATPTFTFLVATQDRIQAYVPKKSIALNASSTDSEGEITYFSSNESVISVDNGNNTAIIEGYGTATVTAFLGPTENYNDATIEVEFDIQKATPVISNFANVSFPYRTTYTFAAVSSNQHPITYTSSNPAVAQFVTASTVLIKQVGTTFITASLEPSPNYTTIPPVTIQLEILPAATGVEFFLSTLNCTAVLTTSLIRKVLFDDIIELSISVADASRMFIYFSESIHTQNALVLQQLLNASSILNALTKIGGKTIIADAYDYFLQQSNVNPAEVHNELEWKLFLQSQFNTEITNKFTEIGLLHYQNTPEHTLQPLQSVTSNNEFLYFPPSHPKNICSSILKKWQSLNREYFTTTFPVYNSQGNLVQSGSVQTLQFEQDDSFSFIIELNFFPPVDRRRYKISWVVG
jgi:hypothetical protein